MDDNRNKKLTADEIQYGAQDFGLQLSREQASNLLKFMDKDNTGSVNFDEFLLALQPPMTESRLSFVTMAFNELDTSGDKQIDSKVNPINPNTLNRSLTHDAYYR